MRRGPEQCNQSLRKEKFDERIKKKEKHKKKRCLSQFGVAFFFFLSVAKRADYNIIIIQPSKKKGGDDKTKYIYIYI